MRALIRRIVDHILGCRPKQVAKRLEPYGWSGHIDNPEFPADWDPPSAALKVPEPWARTEVVEFEPSDQFKMPEAMGIDYIPEQDSKTPGGTMSADLLRRAADAERAEWGDPETRRVFPKASAVHLALADWLAHYSSVIDAQHPIAFADDAFAVARAILNDDDNHKEN